MRQRKTRQITDRMKTQTHKCQGKQKGNLVDRMMNIKEYWPKLPKSSTYTQSLNAQPVHDCDMAEQTTAPVRVAGTMKFGPGAPKNFQQNSILTDSLDRK